VAIVIRALPFNEMLETAVIPKLFEIKESLFGSGTCKFTAINYRDKKTHEVKVRVTRVSNSGQPAVHGRELRIEGIILEIDGKSWGPPANGFDSRYIEDSPRASGFKIVNHSAGSLADL
jgi:hypothetical protein